MNRGRLRNYKIQKSRKKLFKDFYEDEKVKGFQKKINEANDILKEWQKKVIKLLPDSKKSLRKSIGKSDLKEQQLSLFSYLKLRVIYNLAYCLNYRIKKFIRNDESRYYNVNEIYGELREFENFVFDFINYFNGYIDDFLTDEVTGFFRMHECVTYLEDHVNSSAQCKDLIELFGGIKANINKVIPYYSYSKIIDIISRGKINSLYGKVIGCKEFTEINIDLLKLK